MNGALTDDISILKVETKALGRTVFVQRFSRLLTTQSASALPVIIQPYSYTDGRVTPALQNSK